MREFDSRAVLRELSHAPSGRLTLRELADLCAIPARRRAEFRRFLKSLVRDGRVRLAKGRGYCLARGAAPARELAIEGVVRRHAGGFGFLLREDEEDLFLSRREMDGLLDGDRVLAVPVAGRFGRPAGRVLEVVERGRESVTGVYEKVGARERVVPDPELFGAPVELVPGAVEPRPGEVVEVELVEFPRGSRPAVGRIVEILGAPGELGTIVEAVIRRHGLPRRFSDAALEEAAALPAGLVDTDGADRRDLRNEPTFTIDGGDARDFDDAVAVTPRPDGATRLRVSIADVAHWVRADSALDAEAFERGTSAYFPDRVIPMLPERLSNDIASLRPHEDRLTVTVEMDFDASGRRTRRHVFESRIRSAGRWTYDGMARVLDGRTVPGISEYREQAVLMRQLMRRLRRRREERGSIDFDFPEPDVVLDARGRAEDILRRERNDAHRIIEEFMIAANEAIADWLVRHKREAIFRVHAPPDPRKLREFVEFARNWGHGPDFGGLASSRAIAVFLRGVAGAPAERAIHRILLRSMMRAEYSAENIGHFGLASSRYLHFTSPIRRYPDLVVHRLVKAALRSSSEPISRANLVRVAARSTEREQRAARCELQVLDVMRASLLAERIGEEFDGIISGVIEEGFFVELLDVYAEGMVRVEDLGDTYRYVRESRVLVGRRGRRRFAIGDAVRVAVRAAHVAAGRVEFALLATPRPPHFPNSPRGPS